MNENVYYDLIVIGGGASGMMAGAVAAANGQRVLLLEKSSRLGEKLRVSGGGRCNILNAEEDTRTLLYNYGKADKFLFSAFSIFGMQDTINFFEARGLPIKVEARKRAFPVSDSASDVVATLESELRKNQVDIINNFRVDSIEHDNSRIISVSSTGKKYNAKNYVFATGGLSRPETGSTGDGFSWLQKLGHIVKESTPNITPLKASNNWLKSVSGVSAKSVDIIFYLDKKRAFKLNGNVLFTHFGISGPLILNNAYRVAELLEQGDVTAEIDCYPKLNTKELDNNVLGILAEHKVKQLKNTLRYIVPEGLNKAFVELLDKKINLNTINSELNKQDRLALIKVLKAMPLNIEGLMGFEKAVVADGGVDLTEIDMRTFKSKIIGNLYITGDLLDITRPSGGYSLQLCWTSGYIAGIESITRKEPLKT